ncbi:hypothetical protein [uncultured Roseibium sp.]|uniref:hypothetical protein n=1 Tax=uncultured Roseibium sp. TaxID=1936171 RepID=UPI002627B627|nr:hypothetical protein [uncultured Roseibium sp.]
MLEIEVQFGDMGRTKEFPERKTLTLPEGTGERIKAVKRPGEDDLDVVRSGLFKELDYREEIERRVQEEIARRLKAR